jgi:hypothetical protein
MRLPINMPAPPRVRKMFLFDPGKRERVMVASAGSIDPDRTLMEKR